MASIADAIRTELIAILAANAPQLRDRLRAELAKPITVAVGRRLQFEIDPWWWGISCCATEETLFDGESLSGKFSDDWFEQADEAGVNWVDLLSDEVCHWFANCWKTVGGPTRFSPAFLFLHGYHDQQFDLELRCWAPTGIAFRSAPRTNLETGG